MKKNKWPNIGSLIQIEPGAVLSEQSFTEVANQDCGMHVCADDQVVGLVVGHKRGQWHPEEAGLGAFGFQDELEVQIGANLYLIQEAYFENPDTLETIEYFPIHVIQ